MKKITLLLMIFLFLEVGKASGQCEASIMSTLTPQPVDNSGSTTPFIVLFNNEYTNLTGLLTGDTYTLSTGSPSFITVRNPNDNSVIAFGPTPFSFSATLNSVEVHLFANSTCNNGDFIFTNVLATNESTLGINEYGPLSFSTYPNPVKDFYNIDSNQTIDSVKVYNLLGEAQLDLYPNSMTPRINLSLLEKGFYLIEIKGANMRLIKKILKE